MESLIVPFILLLIVLIFVLPPIALVKANRALRGLESLKQKFREMERPPEASEREPTAPSPIPGMPPPLPVQKPAPVIPVLTRTELPAPAATSVTRPTRQPINWEQFMGAKMFAWVGGFALFLGVAFFVKYSFEHNLIPAEVRASIGFIIGAALVIGGVALKRKENVVTAQTLCATGILILYAVTFACRAFYHFSFFGLLPTFALMTLVTATAFLLSVRMNALVVAVLGIAGGFLTPVLLSTGQDNPFGLFGYIALLDLGLLLLAWRKQWTALPVLGAIGTIAMQVAWIGGFFLAGKYFLGSKTLIPMGIFAALAALFVAAAALTRREQKLSWWMDSAGLGVAAFQLLAAFYFLSFSQIAHRPLISFQYLFLIDVLLLALIFRKQIRHAIIPVGAAVFVWLAIWTQANLTAQNLYYALAAYFVFALLHSSLPLIMQRSRNISAPLTANLFPAATLLLILLPILKLATSSVLVWPLVFCIDLIALIAAIATGTLAAVGAVLVLTLVALAVWIFQVPAELTGFSTALFLIGGFAIFFIAATTFVAGCLTAAREIAIGALKIDRKQIALQLPAFSAALPFLLLIMASLRLPLTNPTPLFALAFLLAVLLLGLAKIFTADILSCVALACALALEIAWHSEHFQVAHPIVPLIWYLVFAGTFAVFPFIFHRQFAQKTFAWVAAALSAPLHFFLVYAIMRTAYLTRVAGLLPAAFAIPSVLGLALILRRMPQDSPSRNAQLALFGGATLFFITLIFPIQFERQWITIGWALEAVALCWLFLRVPHPGLRIAAIVLLIFAFARLALNPAVLTYHPRTATPILNWYLYTYGIVALCAFVAAKILAPPLNRVLGRNVLPLLYAFGTILIFLLLNIEIADYFAPHGALALTFQFSGNFARDMSYSIAWAIFALLLLIVGIQKRTGPVRYAGLALLAIVTLKLFLHDLSQLDQLYRIAAFVVVALIAILASFLYQRFAALPEKESAQ